MAINEQLGKDFSTHLFIEFFFQKSNRGFLLEQSGSYEHRRMLIEQYGVFNGCYEIAKKISNELPQLYKENKIFIPIESELIWKVEIISDKGVEIMSYDPDETILNNVFNIIKLVIRVNPSYIGAKDIIPLFMHELTHAYQDVQMYKSGKSYIDALDSEKYFDNQTGSYANESEIKDKISYFLYFSNQFERGAYMAELSGMLMTNKHKFSSISEVIEFIKGTEVYNFYIDSIEDAVSIMKLKDNSERKLAIGYFNELGGRKFNSFSELYTWLRHRCSSIKKKFEKTIPNIIYNNVEMNAFLRKNVLK